MNVVSRRLQLPEAGAEEEPRHSSVAAVKSLKWAATSLFGLLSVVKLAEPKVIAVGSDFGLWPKNLGIADHALQSSGPMMVEAEPGKVAVPMDSHSLQAAPEPVLVLTDSTAAGSGLEFVMVAIH